MLNRVLMCPPTYFGVEYSINPWMNIDNKVDKAKAQRQWDHLYETLTNLGVKIELIDPVPGLPDMTFAGDCGLIAGSKVLASNFRHPERQKESDYFNRWLEDHGYQVFRLPKDLYFEGLGDVSLFEDTILFAPSLRSSPQALTQIRRVFPELNIVGSLQLKDETFYHSTLAFALVGKDALLYYPEAFTDESVGLIEANFRERFAISERDAVENFACNNIPVGNKVLMYDCSAELEQKLSGWGYGVIKCDMSEFQKSGASVRCLITNL